MFCCLPSVLAASAAGVCQACKDPRFKKKRVWHPRQSALDTRCKRSTTITILCWAVTGRIAISHAQVGQPNSNLNPSLAYQSVLWVVAVIHWTSLQYAGAREVCALNYDRMECDLPRRDASRARLHSGCRQYNRRYRAPCVDLCSCERQRLRMTTSFK